MKKWQCMKFRPSTRAALPNPTKTQDREAPVVAWSPNNSPNEYAGNIQHVLLVLLAALLWDLKIHVASR